MVDPIGDTHFQQTTSSPCIVSIDEFLFLQLHLFFGRWKVVLLVGRFAGISSFAKRNAKRGEGDSKKEIYRSSCVSSL